MLKNFKVFVALGGLRPLLQSAVQHAHGTSLWHPGLEDHPTVVNHRGYRGKKRRAIYFWVRMFFSRVLDVVWVPGSMLSCFSAFPVSFFSASLLFCLSASVPFYFYYSTFFFFNHVFLLLYFLFFCFFASCLYCLFVFSFLLLHFLLFVS